MSTNENICQHCQLPLRTCLKNDDKLNKPLNVNLCKSISRRIALTRFKKAMKRVLGLYNPDIDVYYYQKYLIEPRLKNDIILSLPNCVFDSPMSRIALGDARVNVVTANLKILDVETEYKYLLLELLTGIIYSYLNIF